MRRTRTDTTDTDTDTRDAAVIGAGPMGRALAACLLDAGLDVAVWNRTAGATRGLRERGAAGAPDAATAIASSAVSLINVVDHTVLDEIVRGAGDAVGGRTVVGLTSDTPRAARATAALVADLGGRYVDGAILTPSTTIGSEHARLIVAGDESTVQAVRPVLDHLGTVIAVGPDVTTAASIDVAALDLFWTTVGGFLHGVELARAGGLSARDYLPYAQGIVDILPAIMTDLAERIDVGRHDEPVSSIASIRRSVSHLTTASREERVDHAALAELHRRLADAEHAGHGDQAVSRLVDAPAAQ